MEASLCLFCSITQTQSACYFEERAAPVQWQKGAECYIKKVNDI